MRIQECIIAQYLPKDARPFPSPNHRASTYDGHGDVIVEIPEVYLPNNDNPIKKRHWFKNELIYLAAHLKISSLVPDYDPQYIWCIESDCFARQNVWDRLLQETESCTADFIGVRFKQRTEGIKGWGMWKGLPPEFNLACVGSIYRFSRRAIQVLLERARDNANVFCEISVPSTIRNAGYQIKELKEVVPNIYDRGTIIGRQEQEHTDHNMIWHPVKKTI